MSISSRAIVLRCIPYAGGAQVVKTYTQAHGALSFMARAAGGSRRGKWAALAPLRQVELVYTLRPNKELQALHGASLLPEATHTWLEPEKVAVGLFLGEVLSKCLREENPDPALFEFLHQGIDLFASQPYHPDFHLVFLMRLTRFFGFFPFGKCSPETPVFDLFSGQFTPAGNASVHCLSEVLSQQFQAIIDAPFGESHPITHSGHRRSMLHTILEYYRLHLEGMGPIRSVDVLRDVFS
jgi:DNA repair protein RecO (recombination protein O)